MKLYKVSAKDVSTKWVGAQADAASHRKFLNSVKKIPRDAITTEEVEVPTDKKGLLEWLNNNEE